MKDERALSTGLKMQKANALLDEIDVLLHHNFYSTAINRIYYACFHATKALLLQQDLFPKTHSGVVAMLHKHLVVPGAFDVEKASFFSRLMQERVDDDYSDHAIIEQETVEAFYKQARAYINYIQKILEQNGNEHQQ